MEENMESQLANRRIAKMLEMAKNAILDEKKEEALKCYKAIHQIDPNNVESDLYVYILTPYLVRVYKHTDISKYFNDLITKFKAFLKKIKKDDLSNEELHKIVERIWLDIKENCFRTYNDYSGKKELIKEIQGHCIRLEAAEKVGDCIIAEFPQLKDIAIEVWGYEVGCIYQSIEDLKEKTKYDLKSLDIWENNPMTCDIFQAARKILEINNKYVSPYAGCPQEIEEFFKQAKRKEEEAEEAKHKASIVSRVLIVSCVLIIVWILIMLI